MGLIEWLLNRLSDPVVEIDTSMDEFEIEPRLKKMQRRNTEDMEPHELHQSSVSSIQRTRTTLRTTIDEISTIRAELSLMAEETGHGDT